MNSLDAMSSVKETAFTIIRGQFSDVLTMFLRKDLNTLLGDKSELAVSSAHMEIRRLVSSPKIF